VRIGVIWMPSDDSSTSAPTRMTRARVTVCPSPVTAAPRAWRSPPRRMMVSKIPAAVMVIEMMTPDYSKRDIR
jgi:hypothetical protein